MEDVGRHIRRNAAKGERRAARKLGSRIAARFKGGGLPADLPELGGQAARYTLEIRKATRRIREPEVPAAPFALTDSLSVLIEDRRRR
jgi:hypothetical protein